MAVSPPPFHCALCGSSTDWDPALGSPRCQACWDREAERIDAKLQRRSERNQRYYQAHQKPQDTEAA